MMIDQKIVNRVHRLKRQCRSFSGFSKFYALDESWPSIAILNHLLLPLGGDTERPAAAEEMIDNCAAYVGKVAVPCWEAFGVEPELTDERGQVIISAKVPGADEGRVAVNISRGLRRVVDDEFSEFTVFSDFSRPVRVDENLISLFAFGVCMGLSPFGECDWAYANAEELNQSIDAVKKVLCTSSCLHYQRLFKDEPLGHVAELYLNGLVYPPTYLDEDLPATNTSIGLFGFYREFQVPFKGMTGLAENLCRIPDEQISTAGLVFALAQASPETVSATIRFGAERLGEYSGLLRPAVCQLRTALALGDDWLTSDELSDRQRGQLKLDLELGLLPWVFLPRVKIEKMLSNEVQRECLHHIISFSMEGALRLLEAIVESEPKEFDLRKQLAFLHLRNGSFDKSATLARLLLSEPDCDGDPVVFYLLALSELGKGENAEAGRYFKKAFGGTGTTSEFYPKILKDYLSYLFVSENWEDALKLTYKVDRNSQATRAAMVCRLLILRSAGVDEQADIVRNELLSIHPFEPHLVADVIATSI